MAIQPFLRTKIARLSSLLSLWSSSRPEWADGSSWSYFKSYPSKKYLMDLFSAISVEQAAAGSVRWDHVQKGERDLGSQNGVVGGVTGGGSGDVAQLDHVGTGEVGSRSPLSQLVGVVLQLRGQHRPPLCLQLLPPVYTCIQHISKSRHPSLSANLVQWDETIGLTSALLSSIFVDQVVPSTCIWYTYKSALAAAIATPKNNLTRVTLTTIQRIHRAAEWNLWIVVVEQCLDAA